MIYHEGCAVALGEGNEIKLRDASAGWWINPKQLEGYGSLQAVRLFAPPNLINFKWGEHTIEPHKWQKLNSADEKN